MSDPRTTPFKGRAQAPRRIVQPVVDLWREPGGPRDSQLLWGERFTPFLAEDNFIYGRADCGYFGWVDGEALGEWHSASHWISARGSFLYAAADLKSAVLARLPFAARLKCGRNVKGFMAADGGFVFTNHAQTAPAADFVAVAEMLVGVPYLWGGRSDLGLDCSGLVQLALQAAGHDAPRDSDMQEHLGAPAKGEAQRGDLVFWKGHVGILLDAETLLHANAHSMCVSVEPLAEAEARIAANKGGSVTCRRRMD